MRNWTTTRCMMHPLSHTTCIFRSNSGKVKTNVAILLHNNGAKHMYSGQTREIVSKMPKEPLIPVHVSPDPDGRITLPKHFSDHLPWTESTGGQAWLLLLEAGRYRLLSDEQVQQDPKLEPIRLLILEGTAAVVSDPSSYKDLRAESIVARLIPVAVALHKQSQRWRISLPGELKVFEPPDCNTSNFSVFFSLDGYFEICYTDLLRRAAVVPLSNQQF